MNITDIEIEEESTELTVQQKIDDVIARMEEITITSQDELQEAAEWLTKNKQTQKFVKEYYEPERKDTYDAYTAVTGEIKKFNDILIKAEKTVKKKMSDYQMEQDRIRREEERKRIAAEEAEKKEAEETGAPAPEPVVAAPAPEPEKVEGVSFVENWTFEIEDKAKIPLEYMIPDEKKIRGVVKAMKGDTSIPGVKAFAEQTVRAR
jgi:ribosome biogenesis SPOUT family RNA methylase Rps3